MLLLRQIQTLIWKNFLISTLRHPVSTPLRALIFPVIFAWVSIQHGTPCPYRRTDEALGSNAHSFFPMLGISSSHRQSSALGLRSRFGRWRMSLPMRAEGDRPWPLSTMGSEEVPLIKSSSNSRGDLEWMSKSSIEKRNC